MFPVVTFDLSFVGEGRLELPILAELVPKTSAATNYATRPYFHHNILLFKKKLMKLFVFNDLVICLFLFFCYDS